MKHHMHRKDFLKSALAAITAVPLFGSNSQAQATPKKSPEEESTPTHDMSQFPANWTRSDQIIMIVYPGFTALDLIGPQYFFGSLMGATVHLAAKSLDPVLSDTGVSVLPTATACRTGNQCSCCI